MNELEKYREKIDQIDKRLIDMLAERFVYASHIGKIKKKKGIELLQSSRWDSVLASRKEYAISAGLTEDFTEGFLNLIHKESLRIQDQITSDTD